MMMDLISVPTPWGDFAFKYMPLCKTIFHATPEEKLCTCEICYKITLISNYSKIHYFLNHAV